MTERVICSSSKISGRTYRGDPLDQLLEIGTHGFVEYHANLRDGLIHQGWKDSDDAIFHEDGSVVLGPVALVRCRLTCTEPGSGGETC